jgi:hypothetical protein
MLWQFSPILAKTGGLNRCYLSQKSQIFAEHILKNQ